MQYIKTIVFVLIVLVYCLSCNNNGIEEPVELYLSVAENSLAFPSDGGSAVIIVSSNTQWNASSSSSWCQIKPQNGIGDNRQVSVSVEPNNTYEKRTSTVSINIKGASHSITVTQDESALLSISSKDFYVTETGGSLSVDIKTNVPYDVTCSVDWIQQNFSKSIDSQHLYFDVLPNEEVHQRGGEIYFKSKDYSLSCTAVVHQEQKDYVSIPSGDVAISGEEQEFSIIIDSNVDNLFIYGPEWIYSSQEEIGDDGKVFFTALKNIEFTPRTSFISVWSEDESCSDSIAVKQEGRTDCDYLYAAQGNNLQENEGELYFSLEVGIKSRYIVDVVNITIVTDAFTQIQGFYPENVTNNLTDYVRYSTPYLKASDYTDNYHLLDDFFDLISTWSFYVIYDSNGCLFLSQKVPINAHIWGYDLRFN